MILYLGGNFPALSHPDEERKIIKKIKDYGSEYHRLVTFFHEDEAKIAVGLVREMINKKPTLRKRRTNETCIENKERVIFHKSRFTIRHLE